MLCHSEIASLPRAAWATLFGSLRNSIAPDKHCIRVPRMEHQKMVNPEPTLGSGVHGKDQKIMEPTMTRRMVNSTDISVARLRV